VQPLFRTTALHGELRCARKKANRDRGHESAAQMPASKAPQAGHHIFQFMIFDIGCRSIQSIPAPAARLSIAA
jgi:hypothetical protein